MASPGTDISVDLHDSMKITIDFSWYDYLSKSIETIPLSPTTVVHAST